LPEKRSHHSSVIHGSYIYIYGGEDNREGKYDSLWRLNLDEFIEMENKVQDSPKNEDEEVKNITENEHDESVNNGLQWELVATQGPSPGPLSYHKATVKGDLMYLFGGMKPDDECNGDLYILNLTTFEWTIDPATENKPEPRDDTSMTSSDTALFVFGGFVKAKKSNDLYMYTFADAKWEKLSSFYEINDFSTEEERRKVPCQRSGQDITYYQNKLYVFGGRNDFNDKLNDTWEFDLGSKTWNLIRLEESPVGRSHHSLVTHGNKMILFGGILEITKVNHILAILYRKSMKFISLNSHQNNGR
jgi:hypothetical protein